MIDAEHPLAGHIRQLIPINGLEPWLQDQVLAQGELVHYARRATVFEEGQDDPYTFFLVDGQLDLVAGDHSPVHFVAGQGDALRAVAQLRPRRYTARCRSAVGMFRIKRSVLDHILSEEQVSKEGGSAFEPGPESDEDDDWMSRLLASELFTRLPPNLIQRFFGELEPVVIEPGEAVVEQGTAGDFLYIAAEGDFAVVRELSGGREQELAVLHPGDVFGEEALISDLPRNATVRSLAGGLVMRLGKGSFEELVSRVALKPLTYSEACERIATGARWLDVRFAEERASVALDDAVHIPLGQLRARLRELDPEVVYIAYCDTGGRASTAAFLLTRNRIEAYYLAGGLQHSPFADAMGGGVETGDAPGADAPEAVAAEADGGGTGAAGADAQALDTDALETDAASSAARSAAEPDVAPGAEPAEPVVEAPVRLQAVQAELDTALGQLDAERGRHEQTLARARTELRALKADRDQLAARADKAVRFARDFKDKLEQMHRALQAEHARSDSLRQEQARQRTEYERRLEMERARLQEQTDSLGARFQHLLAEHRALESAREEERARLDVALQELREERDAAEARVAQLQERLDEAQRQHTDALEARDDALQTANAKVDVLEAEVATSRSRIEVLEARFEASRQTILAQESELEDAARETERERAHAADLAALKAEYEVRLRESAAELQRLQGQLDGALLGQGEAEAEALARRQQLDVRSAELDARDAALAARLDALEHELTARREAVEAELAGRRAGFEDELLERRAQVDAARAALDEEKAGWDARIEAAIGAERAELGSLREALSAAQDALEVAREDFDAQARQREETLQAERVELSERAAALERTRSSNEEAQSTREAALAAREQALERAAAAVERERGALETLSAEQEALLTERIAAGVEQLMVERSAALEAVAEQRLQALRRDADRRVAEQGALFADKRRQLENEIVRLREVLESRPPPREAPGAAPPTTAGAAGPDSAPVPPPDKPAAEVAAAGEQARPGRDPGSPALDEPPAEAGIEVPEGAAALPDGGALRRAGAARADDAERNRLIAPDQLAAIRRRMREKMDAARERGA